MRIYDIIEKKRLGLSLNKEEIDFFIKSVVKKTIPDYQISALLMAICINGMSETETIDLTLSMANSGEIADLSSIVGETCDKHSTGGVGDKTTFIVAPILAANGIFTAKMSGRGLGYTGGTIDKLQSIPGFLTNLKHTEFIESINKIGLAITSSSGNLAPADKTLYELRDATATVDSIPLIASSVMSKKIAAGSKNIVLDVKCGSGAFINNIEDAKKLALLMVKIGKAAGRKITALITNMNYPLGNNIGNSLEIEESLDVLSGKIKGELLDLSLALAAEGIALAKKISIEKALQLASMSISSKDALNLFLKMVENQKGDIKALKKSKYHKEVIADSCGYVTNLDAKTVGIASSILGAGRSTYQDNIDYAAGIKINKHINNKVNKGDVLATLYSNDDSKFKDAEKLLLNAYNITDTKIPKQPIILARIEDL